MRHGITSVTLGEHFSDFRAALADTALSVEETDPSGVVYRGRLPGRGRTVGLSGILPLPTKYDAARGFRRSSGPLSPPSADVVKIARINTAEQALNYARAGFAASATAQKSASVEKFDSWQRAMDGYRWVADLVSWASSVGIGQGEWTTLVKSLKGALVSADGKSNAARGGASRSAVATGRASTGTSKPRAAAPVSPTASPVEKAAEVLKDEPEAPASGGETPGDRAAATEDQKVVGTGSTGGGLKKIIVPAVVAVAALLAVPMFMKRRPTPERAVAGLESLERHLAARGYGRGRRPRHGSHRPYRK